MSGVFQAGICPFAFPTKRSIGRIVRYPFQETFAPFFHLVERTFGSFRRSFTLPRTVDAEAIEANYEDGLLTIHMPKAAEAKSRKIKVAQKA